MTISEKQIKSYIAHLTDLGRSEVTTQKYHRELLAFAGFIGRRKLKRELAERYIAQLECSDISKNVAIAAMNGFFECMDVDFKLKPFKIQDKAPLPMLTKDEYFKLFEASGDDEELALILQVICATGLRASELQLVTVELLSGDEFPCPAGLKSDLLSYAEAKEIAADSIFPLDRQALWRRLKTLARKAGVEAAKASPEGLRRFHFKLLLAYRLSWDGWNLVPDNDHDAASDSLRPMQNRTAVSVLNT